jgi:SulP family sulfate permease
LLVPKIITTLKGYDAKTFLGDLGAGVIVGIVALPLAIAFAIASGVPPERGLFTAIVAGFAISLLGGSRVQIGGPTGAFVVIVYSIVQKFGYSGLVTATIMAGIFLIAMGLLKLGGLIRFIPYSIIVGFTSGIAVLIATSQIGDFLGLNTGPLPSEFAEKLIAYAKAIATASPPTIAVGLGTLSIVAIWPRVVKKIPGSLVAVVAATLAVKLLDLPVATIGSRFGPIPSGLPAPSLPDLSLSTITSLAPSAISIALLAAIESLLSAVVADGMLGTKHRSNMELVAQGVANVLSPVFGGIPATGAIARTATNVRNGGKTPVAGIVHALTLLLIMLLFGKYAVYIPMPALAAVLLYVAWNMAETHAFKALLKGSKSDAAVLLTTFLLTVFLDLTVAIQVGMVLAAFLFIKKMVDVSNVKILKDQAADGQEEGPDANSLSSRPVPRGALVFEIDGPFFFGSIQKLEEAMAQAPRAHKVLVLRMRKASYLDADGIRAIGQLDADCRKRGVALLVSDIHTQPYMMAVKSGLEERIGKDRFFGNLDDALSAAAGLMGQRYESHKSEFEPTVEREKK